MDMPAFLARLFNSFHMDADTGVEVPTGTEGAADPSAQEQPPSPSGDITAEPQQADERTEKAFANRLASERKKLEAEFAEKYKDYDTLKDVSEYFRQVNNFDDVLSMKEQIELQRLQERAAVSDIPVEVQRRLEELESRAERADKLEQEKELQDWYRDFRNGLEKFAGEKGVDANELEKFMSDNQITNSEMAYRAMTFTDAEARKEEIKQQAIQDYLNSKKAPRVEGAATPGYIPPATPKTWKEATAGALEMIRSMRQQQ
ncbi:hypothetical protein [Paenibacillus sp. NEAU-GSW1]|uniref:hypothetical protein n=1 Tax=Paenibacillus sp. NEAU-GSW1 TaxID=2682486 RepID=UPI0012E25B3B|nr:hypothetical protein [Paenibacillus sp. NEAU-GSW1]MUT66016.1 hypothetical protein [Paenibacillus sp. NEAU-GSW1]